MYLSPFRNLNRNFDVGYHHFEPLATSLANLFDYEINSYSRRFEAGEKDGNLTLTLELPGFKQSDVDIKLERGILTVSAKNARDEITQSINVGRDIDADKVEAKLEDGLLQIVLPKLDAAKPKRILLK